MCNCAQSYVTRPAVLRDMSHNQWVYGSLWTIWGSLRRQCLSVSWQNRCHVAYFIVDDYRNDAIAGVIYHTINRYCVIDDLMQNECNYTANALELPLFGIKPSMYRQWCGRCFLIVQIDLTSYFHCNIMSATKVLPCMINRNANLHNWQIDTVCGRTSSWSVKDNLYLQRSFLYLKPCTDINIEIEPRFIIFILISDVIEWQHNNISQIILGTDIKKLSYHDCKGTKRLHAGLKGQFNSGILLPIRVFSVTKQSYICSTLKWTLSYRVKIVHNLNRRLIAILLFDALVESTAGNTHSVQSISMCRWWYL